jgi:hypothetical protein
MTRHARALAGWTALAGLGLLAALAGCDPVHSDQVAALGGETNGVGPGPRHRPGQPCTLCHDGTFGKPKAFAVAGTVFATADATTAMQGVDVTLTGADGKTFVAHTNEAGNFYVTPGELAPRYPMHVSISSGGTTVTMQSHVGWAASCATCHADPAGPDSPGHVYFEVPNGQVP